MTGHIILCADDYALAPGVSRAIRMLAAANRISATSAIVTGPKWAHEAQALKPLINDIAVGLHLNLTLGSPLNAEWAANRGGTFPSLRALIVATHMGQIRNAGIANEIERQLDAFEVGLGVPPDHVDGHEHVHVLPNIRGALLAILKRRYPSRKILVRDPAPNSAHAFNPLAPRAKSLALRLFTRHMRSDIERHGLLYNDNFAGLTAFEATQIAVARDFAAAATLEGWRPLAVCHPGFPDAELAAIDPVTERRQLEFDALMGPMSMIQNIWQPIRDQDGSVQWQQSKMERLARVGRRA